MGTVVNPHGPVAILWRFSNGCEIKRKRVKHAINVVVARFEFRQTQSNLQFVFLAFFFIIVIEYT